jgi:hypothetical protein
LYSDNFDNLTKYLNEKKIEVHDIYSKKKQLEEELDELVKLQYESQDKGKPRLGVSVASLWHKDPKTKLELSIQEHQNKYNELRDKYGIQDTEHIIYWLNRLKPIYASPIPAATYYALLPFRTRQPKNLRKLNGGKLKSRSNKTNPKKTKRNKKNRRKNGSSLRTR